MKLDALAFGAHPDDVELSCAGTLIKLLEQGYAVGMISLTRGEMGTRGTPGIRQAEFEASAQIMSISAAKLLDIPDGNIELNQENRMKVIRQIRLFKPRIVFLPFHHDRHPDHANASNLIREASFLAGLRQIRSEYPPFRPSQLIYYPCHTIFTPTFIVDVSAVYEKKLEAIHAYKSQFYNPDSEQNPLEEQTYLSRPEFMESVITRNKYFGSLIGAAFGEPFWIQEALSIEDPVAQFSRQIV